MDEITKSLGKHYKTVYKKYGPNAQGVDWKNQNEAEIRYQAMLNVIENGDLTGKKKISILDVGCGYGGQYIYAKEKGMILDYTGIDIVPGMIVFAKKNTNGANFILADIFEHNPKIPYDYVVCNGILTQKLTATTKQMEDFSQKLISKMFELAKVGIVFNAMTTKVDFKKKGNYYVDPTKMLNLAFRHTRKVKIDHSYPLYEYSIYMYK